MHQDDFWKFWDLRPALMREVEEHDYLLASGRVAKHPSCRVPSRNIYNESMKVYFLYEWSQFAVLQSSLHQEWAFWNSGTLGASTLRYSTSTSLETWPMPPLFPEALYLDWAKPYHVLLSRVSTLSNDMDSPSSTISCTIQVIRLLG